MEKYKLLFLLIYFSLISISSSAQNICIVKGRVKDAVSQIAIYDVNVIIDGTSRGTTTDSTGYFQLELPSNNSYTIIFDHINYDKSIRKLFVKKNEEVEFNIKLKFRPIVMQKVTITSDQDSEQIHFEEIRALWTINHDELKKAGGNDIEKALVYLFPGMLYKDWFHDRYSGRDNLYNDNSPNYTLYVNRKLMDSSYLDEIKIDEIKYMKVWQVWQGMDMAPIDMPLVEGNYVLLIVTK